MPGPLRRVRNTFCRHSDGEDAVMSDATTSAVDTPAFPTPLAPSRSANSSSSLGKRSPCRERSSERASKRIAAMTSSSTTPDFSPGDISTPILSPTHTSIPNTFPSKRPNLSLNPIDNASANVLAEPSTSTSHCPEPASPAPTEIANDISHIEQSHEERAETLREAGIKVRDFAYDPMPNSDKAPEVFDPIPSLIIADWHMRNPDKNRGLLSSKSLFRLLKIGWLTLSDIRSFFNPYDYLALAYYNDKPEDQRYPFVVAHPKDMPTPSQRVRLRRQAGLPTYPEDFPDSVFFGYDPTGYSDDEGEGKGGPPPLRAPTPHMPAEMAPAEGVVVAKAEAEAVPVVVGGPKPKRRKAKGTAKTRGRAKPKPLRRECSRPEV